IVRIPQIRDVLDRAEGRHGTTVLARLIDDRTRSTTISRSEAEERMLALIRRAQLPAPEMNADLHGYSVDFLWRQHRLVVEVDGHTYHTTKSAFERDRRKDATLQSAGWLVIRFTWQQIHDEPYAVIAQLAQAL